MVKVLRLAIVLILIGMPFFYAQAQGGYVEKSVWSNVDPATKSESDFIITSDGTKLFGVIVRDFDYTEYDKVDFEFNGSVKTYLPLDLQAFGLDNGRFFMSKRLSESSDLEFVQILFSGSLQLDYKKGKYYLDNGMDVQELRSYYQDIPGAGSPKTRYVKLYISILKINTSGKCGLVLKDLIERSKLNDQDLMRILTQYHECEKLPYKLHIEKIPFLKISPTVTLGVGTDFTKSPDITENINYAFSNSLSYRAFAGVRLHDFRRFPKSSFDFRVGYIMRSAAFDASYVVRHQVLTARQEFKESVVVLPFSFNYSFIKKGDTDIYMGLILTGWFSSIQNDVAVIDQNSMNDPSEILLFEREFMKISDNGVKPGIKAGANFPFMGKKKLYTEMEVDFMKDYYSFQLLTSPVLSINRTYVSFQVGLEF